MQRQRYRIDEFSSLVHPRDGHPKIFAMIDAYLDESGIHDQAAVCVVAGYFGGQSAMKRLEQNWLKILKKFNFLLEEFHAKDLVKFEQYQPMLTELAKAIGLQRKVHPVIFGVVVSDFKSFSLGPRRWFTGARLDEETGRLITNGCPDKPYFLPFQKCLKTITDCAPIGGKAHFFCGLDKPFSKYAMELFADIHKQIEEGSYPGSDWKSKDRIGDPSFPLAKKTPQLQAADLLVHLAYRHMRECQSAKNWDILPPALLSECLRNARSTHDRGFYGREELKDHLEKSRAIAGNWDA